MFMDVQASLEEKGNRYDWCWKRRHLCVSLRVTTYSSGSLTVFQGDLGPSGAPGIPGKEGLVGPKVRAMKR